MMLMQMPFKLVALSALLIVGSLASLMAQCALRHRDRCYGGHCA
jgi:hypothetical protein